MQMCREILRSWIYAPQGADTMFMAMALVLVGLCFGVRKHVLAGLNQLLRPIDVRPGLGAGLLGVLTLALHAATGLVVGLPAPEVHDEFSYLLAADTFTHGRLTNPTHACWEHFESFHILQTPTYQSKYPPLQGAILAIGSLCAGRPIVGVWISMALAAMAIYWMLLGGVGPRWALLAGLLYTLHRHLFWDWGQTYWGGAAAVTGGALVCGATLRLFSGTSLSGGRLLMTGGAMAVGASALANSRPYEGLLLCLPAAAVTVAWLVRQSRSDAACLTLPCVLILGAVGWFMGKYNMAVTGDVGRLPYQVYESTYSIIPLFTWQTPRPEILYRHALMREYYVNWAQSLCPGDGGGTSTFYGLRDRLYELWRYFLGVTLTIPLLSSLAHRWSVQMLFVAGSLAVMLTGMQLALYSMAYYLAPGVPLILWLVVQGGRRLCRWRPGRMFVAALVLAWGGLWIHSVWIRRIPPEYSWGLWRAELAQRLQADGRDHLVIVRYGSAHSPTPEWVYNAADIDAAPVVWARDMGEEGNRTLLRYFQDRVVHLLWVKSDAKPPQLIAYPGVKATASGER